jgi:hypothetical protein
MMGVTSPLLRFFASSLLARLTNNGSEAALDTVGSRRSSRNVCRLPFRSEHLLTHPIVSRILKTNASRSTRAYGFTSSRPRCAARTARLCPTRTFSAFSVESASCFSTASTQSLYSMAVLRFSSVQPSCVSLCSIATTVTLSYHFIFRTSGESEKAVQPPATRVSPNAFWQLACERRPLSTGLAFPSVSYLWHEFSHSI